MVFTTLIFGVLITVMLLCLVFVVLRWQRSQQVENVSQKKPFLSEYLSIIVDAIISRKYLPIILLSITSAIIIASLSLIVVSSGDGGFGTLFALVGVQTM
jgi:hypothetical protein